MAKPLLAEVLANVTMCQRNACWLDRLPRDLAGEVQQIRKQFADGSLGTVDATNLARAITKSLEARGVAMPKHKQVQRWLRDSLTK